METGLKDDQSSSTIYQQIIVKFTDWLTRTAVYRARKKLNGRKLFLDLPARRASLLSRAIARVESMEDGKYAFDDINCRLGLKMPYKSLRFFSNESELEKLLESGVAARVFEWGGQKVDNILNLPQYAWMTDKTVCPKELLIPPKNSTL